MAAEGLTKPIMLADSKTVRYHAVWNFAFATVSPFCLAKEDIGEPNNLPLLMAAFTPSSKLEFHHQ
ncbi:hypothetical protein JKP76_11225 [Blastococcus sp. TML/C7B]|uniref:hypothetical protein n=1 Tax=Blastococcus sp. TML/C7B TaxID=2798728 RepID=UPI00190B2598|nr:hypothetical protein [Blastococcus sp. TML/C7B]MBN1096552.1 hypothetical protein [Blastococcus sp. TML/C7B]